MTNQDNSSNDNPPSVPLGLKIFVYALGIMIIVMLIVMIVKVVNKPNDTGLAVVTSEVQTLSSDGVLEWRLDVPDGAVVESTHMERGILTVVVTSPEGDQVWLVDAKNRVLIGKVVLE